VKQVLPKLLIACAVVLLAAGGLVAWRQWQGNKQADAVAARNQYRANHGHATGNNPSTTRPGADAYDAWKVPDDQPRYIFIQRLKVKAVVKPVGLTKDGAVGAPNNIYDAAWYVGSAKPGASGATFIDGHVSSWTTNGVFHDLGQLKPGDEIKIERGDGEVLKYEVTKTATYDVGKINMKAVLAPINPHKPGLNLMTCTGNVIHGTSEFNRRVVVFAEQL
jgi:LPXTG-site transpeptidase (sortase) family protein